MEQSAALEDDFSPRLERSEDAMFERVERERDAVYDVLAAALGEMNVRAELTRSSPYAAETWVQIRAWRKRENGLGTARGELSIEIEGRAGMQQPVLRLRAQAGSRARTVTRIRTLTPLGARAAIEFMLGMQPRLRRSHFDRYGLLFGRNRRRVVPGSRFLNYLGFLALLLARGRLVTLSEGRPLEDPRELIRMDSWQTVVIGIGDEAESVRQQVTEELLDGIHPDARVGQEDIAYLSADGSVRRRQIAVRFRRALAFVEIHGYGDDLYTDWEAYLNIGRWQEVATGHGYADGAIVRAMSTVRSLEPLNEYDLSDANFLIEWVHACLTKVLRRVVKEQRIDQEIDFMILRADRRSVMDEARSRGEGRDGGGGSAPARQRRSLARKA